MEVKNKRNLLQAGVPIVAFIMLILLIKYMSNNHQHSNCSHNHSPVELVDTLTTVETDTSTVDDLIQAMIYVESRNNDSAYHAGEKAAGCLQIRPIMVAEVNRLLKRRGESRRFTLADRWSRVKSIEMFKVFNNKVTDWEVMARRWNGGPMGHKKAATLGYWKRVLNNIKNV